MIVPSDTGPLNYLIRLNLAALLHERYGVVIIPDAVRKELQAPGVPSKVSAWIALSPGWIAVRQAMPDQTLPSYLGEGEREAISLASQLSASLLLADDRAATVAARKRNITVNGTLAILIQASQESGLDLSESIRRLLELGFYASPSLIAFVLSHAAPAQTSPATSSL